MVLLMGLLALSSCSDDRDDNPTMPEQSTLKFTINTPALTNSLIDLSNSENIVLTGSQPNYGFPVSVNYTVEVALTPDMAGATQLSTVFQNPTMELNANEVAVALTNMELAAGKSTEDFPMTVPVYLRAKAEVNTIGGAVEGTSVVSNVVALNKVYLEFSLPDVKAPTELFVIGDFNGWSWDTAPAMVPVYGADGLFWRMVYINESGLKFNSAKSWDGGERGFNQITVQGDRAADIVDGGGNIASSKPGWYLMIVQAEVQGRDIVYTVTFQDPTVQLMGSVTGSWDEGRPEWNFSVPADKDGEFVSPAFASDSEGDGGVRAFVKVPGHDWWHSEFMVFSDKIEYRGQGGDQARIEGSAGQKLHLNFSNDTGYIK